VAAAVKGAVAAEQKGLASKRIEAHRGRAIVDLDFAGRLTDESCARLPNEAAAAADGWARPTANSSV
jgi:hypothetical protein